MEELPRLGHEKTPEEIIQPLQEAASSEENTSFRQSLEQIHLWFEKASQSLDKGVIQQALETIQQHKKLNLIANGYNKTEEGQAYMVALATAMEYLAAKLFEK